MSRPSHRSFRETDPLLEKPRGNPDEEDGVPISDFWALYERELSRQPRILSSRVPVSFGMLGLLAVLVVPFMWGNGSQKQQALEGVKLLANSSPTWSERQQTVRTSLLSSSNAALPTNLIRTFLDRWQKGKCKELASLVAPDFQLEMTTTTEESLDSKILSFPEFSSTMCSSNFTYHFVTSPANEFHHNLGNFATLFAFGAGIHYSTEQESPCLTPWQSIYTIDLDAYGNIRRLRDMLQNVQQLKAYTEECLGPHQEDQVLIHPKLRMLSQHHKHKHHLKKKNDDEKKHHHHHKETVKNPDKHEKKHHHHHHHHRDEKSSVKEKENKHQPKDHPTKKVENMHEPKNHHEKKIDEKHDKHEPKENHEKEVDEKHKKHETKHHHEKKIDKKHDKHQTNHHHHKNDVNESHDKHKMNHHHENDVDKKHDKHEPNHHHENDVDEKHDKTNHIHKNEVDKKHDKHEPHDHKEKHHKPEPKDYNQKNDHHAETKDKVYHKHHHTTPKAATEKKDDHGESISSSSESDSSSEEDRNSPSASLKSKRKPANGKHHHKQEEEPAQKSITIGEPTTSIDDDSLSSAEDDIIVPIMPFEDDSLSLSIEDDALPLEENTTSSSVDDSTSVDTTTSDSSSSLEEYPSSGDNIVAIPTTDSNSTSVGEVELPKPPINTTSSNSNTSNGVNASPEPVNAPVPTNATNAPTAPDNDRRSQSSETENDGDHKNFVSVTATQQPPTTEVFVGITKKRKAKPRFTQSTAEVSKTVLDLFARGKCDDLQPYLASSFRFQVSFQSPSELYDARGFIQLCRLGFQNFPVAFLPTVLIRDGTTVTAAGQMLQVFTKSPRVACPVYVHASFFFNFTMEGETPVVETLRETYDDTYMDAYAACLQGD